MPSVKGVLFVSAIFLLTIAVVIGGYLSWSLNNQLKETQKRLGSSTNQLGDVQKKLESSTSQLRDIEKKSAYLEDQLSQMQKKLESIQKIQKLAGYSKNEITVSEEACNFPEDSQTKSFSVIIRATDINKMESDIFSVIERYGGTTSVYTFPATANIPTRSKTLNAFYLPLNQADPFIKDIRNSVQLPNIFIKDDVYGEDSTVFKRNCQFFLDSVKRFRGEETTYLDQLKKLEDPVAQKLIKEKIDQLRGRSNEYNSQLEYISRIRDRLQVFITIEAFSS